jgi:hypothetical protein
MNNIDTAAIVATVGTIAALVVIALFLRGCGKGKDIPTMNPGTGSKPPSIHDETLARIVEIEGIVKDIDSNRPRDYGPFIDRIKNMSDTGSGVTDEQMERIVSASEPARVMYGSADDPRWSRDSLEGSLIRHHLIDEIDDQCAQRIADDKEANP